MKKILLTAVLAALVFPACAELVVVVNPKNPVATMTADQVAQVFLGRSSSFPAGGNATPVDQKEGVAIRDEFYTKVADKNPGQVKAYWAKQMFSGKGSPPREAASSADVKHAVASDAGAIGYIEKSAVDSSVKAVLTVQ
jgi:ABC-type phosphate transport system substrate-binding protein